MPQGFFVPGPNAEKYPGNFICPAGPGMQPVPEKGKWLDVTPYLLSCIRSGDLAEGNPEPPKEKKPPKAKTKPVAKKETDK